MSQRNPMNERYRPDAERDGRSRKSATSAKPKRKASEGIHVQKTTKTKDEKRKEASARRKDDRIRVQSSGGPQDPEYKRWRKIWWTLMAVTIAFTFVYMILATNESVPHNIPVISLVAAYICLILAVIVEFKFCRPIRKEFERKISNMTVAQKRKYDEELAAKREADHAQTTGWKGFVNWLADPTGKKRKKAQEVAAALEEEQEEAEKGASGDSKKSSGQKQKSAKTAKKEANRKAYGKDGSEKKQSDGDTEGSDGKQASDKDDDTSDDEEKTDSE